MFNTAAVYSLSPSHFMGEHWKRLLNWLVLLCWFCCMIFFQM